MKKYEEMVGGGHEDESASSSEKAFMKGYLDKDEDVECAECGSALREEVIKKELEGQVCHFCSMLCAEEYEESL
jgi:hypothetical protein